MEVELVHPELRLKSCHPGRSQPSLPASRSAPYWSSHSTSLTARTDLQDPAMRSERCRGADDPDGSEPSRTLALPGSAGTPRTLFSLRLAGIGHRVIIKYTVSLLSPLGMKAFVATHGQF